MLPFRPGAAWQTLLLLCVIAFCTNYVESNEGRVVCYYTNWSVYRPGTAKFNPQNINPYLCTHLIYAFGGFTKDNQMKPFDKYQDIEQGGYAKFTGLKTYNKQLKTMIAIGGWNEASSRFSPLVASNERRQQFIKNILKFLRQNHFDGIDLDWEYPAHREGGKSRDRDNYAQFVQELRAEFEREAEKTGRTRLLLTMAVPAGIEYIDKGYDIPKLNKYLDWFNLLTYDFHSSHEPSVNHHAPLYSLEDDSEYNYDAELNIDYSIKYYLKAGADHDKLVLGIPTYGRSYTLINEESTELGSPSEGPGEQGDATREKGYLAYYEICQSLKEDPEWTVVQPNANVMGPYAYRRNQWVGYDDEAIVRKKAEYVVAHGLGGIMFWAIDNDDFRGTCSGKPYPLIEAAKEAMIEALGLGINEVAKSSGPQKPSRSRSRENANNRNGLTPKPEVRRPAATRRPAISTTTIATPSTTIKLTKAEGSSLYVGGRGSTTPAPPTTPDPGSDFKCEEEGFFQHPRDCKKYYWCLDSGPSGLGIVAHQFTCPSGLYFNPAADSCDFARNVPCKTKKSTTVAPITTSAPTTARTTSSYNRVTAAPPARPIYPRVTTSTPGTTTTTTTSTTAAPEEVEYEEDKDDEQSLSKFSEAEEDPQVIKELIDLIRKVGGVEQLEKHLLQNKDGSITLKENSASGVATTPSTISKSLYDRVLSRPGTLNSFTRNRLNAASLQVKSETTESTNVADNSSQNNYSKYSSVLRGNSRQGPQNEGIEKIAEFNGFSKERKQYVTINRNRGAQATAANSENETDDEDYYTESNLAQVDTTKRPLSAVTPSYTSLRRSRPSTTTPLPNESDEEVEQPVAVKEQTQTKHYATLNRNRGRGTTERSDTTASVGAGVSVSSTTNRYKYFERTRPTTSSGSVKEAVDGTEEEADTDEDEEEYEDDGQQQKNNRYQLSRTRGTTTTTTTTTAATPTTRRSFFGSRTRTQVTKLSLVDDDQSSKETEESDEEQDEEEQEEEEEAAIQTTTVATVTTEKPTLKRIRVIKYRRPLQSIDNNNNNQTTVLETTLLPNNNTPTNSTDNTVDTRKRFRKIVRKLRPVDTTTKSPESITEDQQNLSGDTTSTTRKPFQPSRARFESTAAAQTEHEKEVKIEDDLNVKVNVLQTLRNRLKEQQAHEDPIDGVLSSKLHSINNKITEEDNAEHHHEQQSELQRLRDKVKAEQARGNGDQGVINERLKKLLVEKNSSTGATSTSGSRTSVSDTTIEESSSGSSGASPRPFFRRKLVAKRPYNPSSGSLTTKPPLNLSSTRPTAKFVRRKNGRFDPFNSNVRNRGEGFVRSDPREPRLQNTNNFNKQQQNQEETDEDYEEEIEEQQEQPQTHLNARPGTVLDTTVRRPFVPLKKKPTPEVEEEEESEEESDEEGDEEEEEDEQEVKDKHTSQEADIEQSRPAYRSKENRVLPGSRPNFAPTAGGASNTSNGNIPFNPRKNNNSPSSSTPANRFGTSNRPRVVNRPPGVSTSNLTLRPVANNYERTTPLTPLKPAPFIPSNTRSYERKYTGPSTETPEIASENSLIEDLNIDALNARNKKIFDIHSKKHTTLKPKVVATYSKVESTGGELETESEQGYVTTTPSTPLPTTTTTSITQSTDTINTDNGSGTATDTYTDNDNGANEATKISSLPQGSTTLSPPPATTLLHVFTLHEGATDEDLQLVPTGRPFGSKITATEPKHKLIEINRIVEINSKQAKQAQRKSKANNQDFGTVRVESLPHVEQLGEISVVKYVHLVDGSHIQINDGHSTVADYTPTEPIIPKNSPPVRNSLPETDENDGPIVDVERDGKSLLPEVIRGIETSTISLEGLFDSSRKAKQLDIGVETNTERIVEQDTIAPPPVGVPGTETALPVTYVRPILPLLRPESNESSPLIISIANLDKVILSKVPASEDEDDTQDTTLSPLSTTTTTKLSDSNSEFSVRHLSVLQAPSTTTDNKHNIDKSTVASDESHKNIETGAILNNVLIKHNTDNSLTSSTKNAAASDESHRNMQIGAILNNVLIKHNTDNSITKSTTKNTAASDESHRNIQTGTILNTVNTNNPTISAKNVAASDESTTHTTTTLNNNNNNSSSTSEIITYSTETHVVRRKKARNGRNRKLRQRHRKTNTTTTTTSDIPTTTTTSSITTVVPNI